MPKRPVRIPNWAAVLGRTVAIDATLASAATTVERRAWYWSRCHATVAAAQAACEVRLPADPRDWPVSELPIPTRVQGMLGRAGVVYVREIHPDELRRLAGFGSTILSQIHLALASVGVDPYQPPADEP